MIFNPLDKFYKSIIGAVSAQDEVTFRVKGNFDSVVFVLRKDGNFNVQKFEMARINECFEIQLKFESGLYFYYFELNDNKYISNDNFIGVVNDKITEFQLTSYSSDYVVPDWIYGGVIYQIFPDRFYRAEKNKSIKDGKVLHENWSEMPVYLPNEQGKILNNDFFGGDIKGIIEKLEYLVDLGVNVIYLNPIFEAYSNHRYDTGDYHKIDSLLGDEQDFCSLISKASEKNIKVILDGVFNHTGDDSVYFNKYGNYDSIGACQDKNSKYFSWYNFKSFPDEYESWWGVKTLPSINESNEDFVDFITGENGVLSHYTKLGVYGWRLDVVDELPSNFVKKIRERVKKENQDAIVIGEVWEDVSNKISYDQRREYLQGKELDSAMNYPLKNAIIDFVLNNNAKVLLTTIKEQLDHYPHKSLHAMMNMLSTHDTMRILSVLGGEKPESMTKCEMANYKIPENKVANAIFKLKVASLLQFTMCGVPSIYYGDEIGMQGYVDPLNRLPFDWDNQNEQIKDWFKFLSKLRKDYSAFSQGEFEEVFANNGAFCFVRKDENSELFIGVNLNEKPLELTFEGELYNLVSNEKISKKYLLKSNSICVLIKKIENDIKIVDTF